MPLSFLNSGEASKQIAVYDWASTTIGAMENWPAALKINLACILNTRFPAVLYWGKDYITFYNDAYIPLIPGKHPVAIGKKAVEVFGEIWEKIRPSLESVILKGHSTLQENQLLPIYKNGILEDVYWTYGQSPVFDEAGNIRGVMVICTDTSAEVISRNQLEESQQVLHSFFMQAPVPMCILSGPEHEYILANEDYEKFMGEVIGKKVKDILTSEQKPFLKILDDVYSTGKSYIGKNAPIMMRNSDGSHSPRIINYIYQAFKGITGEIQGILVVFQDVTEEINKIDREKKVMSDSKLAALGMMVSEIVHEIKNPLAILQTSCAVLKVMMKRDPVETNSVLSRVDNMTSTIERINHIVSSMRNMARDNSNEVGRIYSVRDLLEDVSTLGSYQMVMKQINFKVNLPEEAAKKNIFCRKLQFSQVLLNLLSNAVHAVENSIDPEIRLEIIDEGKEILFRVSDNGPGVPEELRDKIFTPLFTTKGETEGTGLGLSISKSLLKQNGGTLQLNYKLGPSCFEVRLPIT